MRVLQPCGEPHLTRESLDRQILRQIGRQQLDDDIAAKAVVACDPDAAHASPAEFAANGVAWSKRRSE